MRTCLLLGAALLAASATPASAQTAGTPPDAVTVEPEADILTRLRSQLKSKQWPEAVAIFELLARDRPETLATVNANWLFTFNRELKEAGETALRRRFLRAILTSGLCRARSDHVARLSAHGLCRNPAGGRRL